MVEQKISGIQPICGCTCEPPLTYSADQCDVIMRVAKTGWRQFVDTTEILAALVLQQVVNPGVGILPCTMATPMDMLPKLKDNQILSRRR